MTPTSRGIPTNNIRFHSQPIKMLSGNENSTIALSQVLGQRRVQTVTVQKPQQNVQQQMTIDPSNVSPGPSQQGQIQTSPNPSQTVTQPQNSPQQVKNDKFLTTFFEIKSKFSFRNKF
jgi:hypothetical protein